MVLREAGRIFYSLSSTKDEIGEAGYTIFKLLYGGKSEDSLNKLRYFKYLDMACKGIIEPEKLPPTQRAAYFHSLRVHLQVNKWLLLEEEAELNSEEWGWRLSENGYDPIVTDNIVAPESLLKFIRCKCKITNKEMCATNICSCRKHGLKCMPTCGYCRGEESSNIRANISEALRHEVVDEPERDEIF